MLRGRERERETEREREYSLRRGRGERLLRGRGTKVLCLQTPFSLTLFLHIFKSITFPSNGLPSHLTLPCYFRDLRSFLISGCFVPKFSEGL